MGPPIRIVARSENLSPPRTPSSPSRRPAKRLSVFLVSLWSVFPQPQRQMAATGVAVTARPLDRAGDLEAREAAEQGAEHDAHLEPRQTGAEAEMHAMTEPQMRIGLAPHVELHRMREDALVAVRRPLPEQHLVTRPDRLTAELGRPRGGAALGRRRRRPAQHLLDGNRQ